MSLLAATQIPKPADEQAFERVSEVLWRGLLNDPAVQANGRRGQRQNGVDLYGYRNSDPNQPVGIQCKLKSERHALSKREVRDEVKKAQTFKPPLREYFITTTAPDDAAIHELARELTVELAEAGYPMRVAVWGWNTLEKRISEDAAARKAFDPSYTPEIEGIAAETRSIAVNQYAMKALLETLTANISSNSNRLPGDNTVEVSAVEAHLDAQIDVYRDLNNSGKTLTALTLLEKLLARIDKAASGRLLFRLKANIGFCFLDLGKDDEAAAMLLEAFEHAPGEPKAIANKALALLLKGNWEELLSFGKLELKADPANEWLAGYLVQAASFDMSVDEPLELVPLELRKTAPVMLGRVDFTRRRGKPGEWWEAARAALAAYPQETYSIQFAAVADIDEVVTNKRFQNEQRLSLDERKRLESAISSLRAQWDIVRHCDGPLRPENAVLCGNIVLGLATLGEFSEALKVARQGLAFVSDDQDLLLRATMVAIEIGDFDFAGELLPKLSDTNDTFILKFRYHTARAEWPEIVALFENNVNLIPATEKPFIETTARLAAIWIGNNNPDWRRKQIAMVAQDAVCDPRASVVVSDFARRADLADIADAAFECALRLIEESSNAAERLMVAYQANLRNNPAVVADLLDGKISEDSDSHELRMLAQAFVNDLPIRQRAISFFARLPHSLQETPYYLHLQGLLKINCGALGEAEVFLRRAAAAEPILDNYNPLLSVLNRLDRYDEVIALLDTIDLPTVRGSPAQKMFLARELRKNGRASQALEYGYTVLKSARNDQRAALQYFHLIMQNLDDGLIPIAKTVAVDTWVRFESDKDAHYAFLIEAGPDRPADGIVSPSHPMAAASIGLSVGGEFDLPTSFGETRRWRVAEVKHKFIYALHDVMDSFENRFPNAEGLYKITVGDKDIETALQPIRQAAETNRARADLYLKHNFPICFITASGRRDTIAFADYLRFLNFDIRTCLGTVPERLAARRLLVAHREAGAVLDAYTAWTASTIDAFDVLRSVFGALIVPQTVIDELKNMRGELETLSDRSMWISWHDGQFVRQQFSAEEISARRDYITEQVRRIELACLVRPVIAPDNPTEIAVLINQSFGSHVLDAANMVREGQLLVSEDMHYRWIAEGACGAKSVWLQEIFSFAFDYGLIDWNRYVNLVIKLASRRHGHLNLTAEALLTVVCDSANRKLEEFKAIARFIGVQNAEIRSHIEVSKIFLNYLWRELDKSDLYYLQVTSTLLSQLIRFRPRDSLQVLANLKQGLTTNARHYIDGWIKGHFLRAEIGQAGSSRLDKSVKCRKDRGKSLSRAKRRV